MNNLYHLLPRINNSLGYVVSLPYNNLWFMPRTAEQCYQKKKIPIPFQHLEPDFYTKWPKKYLTSPWFVEYETSEGPEWFQTDSKLV